MTWPRPRRKRIQLVGTSVATKGLLPGRVGKEGDPSEGRLSDSETAAREKMSDYTKDALQATRVVAIYEARGSWGPNLNFSAPDGRSRQVFSSVFAHAHSVC